MGIANNELIKVGVDILTNLLNVINNITEALGTEGFGAWVSGFGKLAVLLGGMKIGGSALDGVMAILKNSFENGGIDAGKVFVNAFGNSIKKNSGILEVVKNTLTSQKLGGSLFGKELKEWKMLENPTALQKPIAKLSAGLLKAKGSAGLLAVGLGKILIAIAAIAAVIWVFKKLGEAIYNATPEGKLEAAQKATEDAAAAADNATNSYENLKNAFEDLGNATNTLEGLTRGTQEWRTAVLDINSAVLDLVNTYPELGAFIENKDGVLSIDFANEDVKEILRGY